VSGAATTCGLNATATPHNPAPAATILTLNRSKIVIDIDSFIHAQTFNIQVMQQNRMPYRSRGWTTASIISSKRRPKRHAAPHRFQMVTFGMV
jgi:hypothetical protein